MIHLFVNFILKNHQSTKFFGVQLINYNHTYNVGDKHCCYFQLFNENTKHVFSIIFECLHTSMPMSFCSLISIICLIYGFCACFSFKITMYKVLESEKTRSGQMIQSRGLLGRLIWRQLISQFGLISKRNFMRLLRKL